DIKLSRVTLIYYSIHFFFFQAEDGIRDRNVTGVQTCALPICDRLSIVGKSPQISISWLSCAEGICEEFFIRDLHCPAAGFYRFAQRGNGLRIGLVVLEDNWYFFLGNQIREF